MGFQYINIRQVPMEVLKTGASGLGFQHLLETWRMLMHENPCLIPILNQHSSFISDVQFYCMISLYILFT